MAKNDKGNTVVRSQSIGNRVLQSRTDQSTIAFNNPDISIGLNINSNDRPNVGDFTITFNKDINAKVNWNIGTNANIFRSYSSSSIVKPFATNIDNNGAGNGSNAQSFNNYLFIDDVAGITSISLSTGAGTQSIHFQVFSNMPEVTSFVSNMAIVPNFAFLDYMQSIKNLNMIVSISPFSNLTSLKNSNLTSLILNGYNTTQPDLLDNLPASLYYLEIGQMTSYTLDLKNYFTGTRIAIGFKSVGTVSYSGGAHFPQVIADTPQYRISHIYSQTNAKLNGTDLSRFLVDFANRVEAVNLGNSTARKMKFTGANYDSAYVDSDTTKTIRTVQDAITKIREGLGITISFS